MCLRNTATNKHNIICASGSVVEHRLAKARAAGSNPVSRLTKNRLFLKGLFFCSVLDEIRTHRNIDFGRMRMEALTPIFSFFMWLCAAKTLRGAAGSNPVSRFL